MKRPRGVSKRLPLRRFLLVAAFAAGLFAVDARRPSQAVAAFNIQGFVAGSYFSPPAGSTSSSTAASYFGNAKVCVDLNNDAVCNPGETGTTTDANGFFTLVSPIGPLTAEVSTASTNGGHPVSERIVFRAAVEQVAEKTVAGQPIVVSPLTTEVVRMMEAAGITYDDAKQSLAMRLGIPASQATSDPNTPSSFTAALLRESVILTNRFVLAGRMVDRHEVSPAALFADPTATGPAITMREAEQAAMNLEYIPRYDHIFIIMLENRQTPTIKGSAFAPNINAYLNAYNQFTSYNATGNPSEPNYTALGSPDLGRFGSPRHPRPQTPHWT